MKGLLYQNLLNWKNKENRKPHILNGARQVGKTLAYINSYYFWYIQFLDSDKINKVEDKTYKFN